jgi:hypothetical protein
VKESFRKAKLSQSNKNKLAQINSIIREYQSQGYVLTLRQLYYQLVSINVIPNKVSEYAKLSTLLTEGRMAGVVDWEAIEDRLRLPYKPSSWNSAEDMMDTAIAQYKMPRTKGQKKYIEVWLEKDALSGVLKRVTSKYHVPIMVNRGYSSVTAIHDSYERFKEALMRGQTVEILYVGDFDPSGLDMIRDVYDRPLEMLLSKAHEFITSAFEEWIDENEEWQDDLEMEYLDIEIHPDCFDTYGEKDPEEWNFSFQKAFVKSRFKVTPIALTRAQIRQYNPPPNPAKRTDPRSRKFMSEHGGSSWEVDALRPEVLNALLTNAIEERLDLDLYNEVLRQEIIEKTKLRKAKSSIPDEVDEDDLTNFESDDEDE